MTSLEEPVGRLVGGRTAKVLAESLDIHTVEDLLRHYPRRYDVWGQLTDLASLRLDDDVTVMAKVVKAHTRRMRERKGTILQVEVTDGQGRLDLTFFNAEWRQRDLAVGRVGLFAGKVGSYRGRRQLLQPDYQMDATIEALETVPGSRFPVYPATSRMPSWKVAKAVDMALEALGELPDPLPADLRERLGLRGLGDALRAVHHPPSLEDERAARRRLAFEEAFVLQVELARRRARARALPAVPRPPRSDGLLATFDERLPFRLTAGQREVGEVLAEDLARAHPMQRLLQGEVGSGKTVVALRAMLAVVDDGGQAALLAPTEVLAQQHHRTLRELMGPLAERGLLGGDEAGTRVALLTGSLGSVARRDALEAAGSGEAGIVVGTHALLEERVRFEDLGLVVVDEQHRFGVEQRSALSAKGEAPPHVLVMTATPIPRTIAMTVFGDLDVSTLTELPVGRSPVETYVVPEDSERHMDRTWERVREEVAKGHQAYVVCPRIGTTDGSDQGSDEMEVPADVDDGADPLAGRRPLRAVLDVAPMLSDGPLAGLRLEVLHGRMPSDAKEDVMRRFAAGDVDVLVATTVIEVGVDVPGATAMVVMDADRFGVSQLHQLRGRVGRGSAPGLCLLVTESPEGSAARARVDAVAATTDGFTLSRVDLANRREGDVLGATQSGRRSSLRLLSVLRDEELIAHARVEAVAVVDADPDLEGHAELRGAVEAYARDARGDFLEKA